MGASRFGRRGRPRGAWKGADLEGANGPHGRPFVGHDITTAIDRMPLTLKQAPRELQAIVCRGLRVIPIQKPGEALGNASACGPSKVEMFQGRGAHAGARSDWDITWPRQCPGVDDLHGVACAFISFVSKGNIRICTTKICRDYRVQPVKRGARSRVERVRSQLRLMAQH
jgi:hypothetical protein